MEMEERFLPYKLILKVFPCMPYMHIVIGACYGPRMTANNCKQALSQGSLYFKGNYETSAGLAL